MLRWLSAEIRVTIDTLEYVKRLEAVGVPRPQAEAHAEAIRDTLAPQLATKADIDRLAQATKADIDRLAQATKADIDRLEQATKADIDRLEHKFEALLWRHTTWVIVTVIGTQLALAGVLLRFLGK
jgi:hypothetical protein